MKLSPITHISEAALYCDNLGKAETFYREVLGFKAVRREERFVALRIVDEQVLLLFHRGESAQDMPVEGGTVSGHDGSGRLHLCFGVTEESLEHWVQHLSDHGVEIENRVHWPHGSKSIYFRDPDQHTLELATPGLWDFPAGT